MGCLGYNIMACDMGALPHQYNDQKAIRILVSIKHPTTTITTTKTIIVMNYSK